MGAKQSLTANIRWSSGNPAEEKRNQRVRDTMRTWHTESTDHDSCGTLRGQGDHRGLTYALYIYIITEYLGLLVGFLALGTGTVSDSFAYL